MLQSKGICCVGWSCNKVSARICTKDNSPLSYDDKPQSKMGLLEPPLGKQSNAKMVKA